MEKRRWTKTEDKIVFTAIKREKKIINATCLAAAKLPNRTLVAVWNRVVRLRKVKQESSVVRVVKKLTFNGDHVRLYF